VKFTALEVDGAFVIDLVRHEDERGWFARAWSAEEFAEHGLHAPVIDLNLSYNTRRGTLRGMHFQRPPHHETKLVRCTAGAIYDVIIDLREDSPSFRRSAAVELTRKNGRLLYIPPGFAHGFQTLEDDTEVLYQMSAGYAADAACGVRYDDPAFGIEWPEPVSVISDRDRSWPDYDPTAFDLTGLRA
jgi:dTDP-4-dehydrorhamnose 3,5-epimerase